MGVVFLGGAIIWVVFSGVDQATFSVAEEEARVVISSAMVPPR